MSTRIPFRLIWLVAAAAAVGGCTYSDGRFGWRWSQRREVDTPPEGGIDAAPPAARPFALPVAAPLLQVARMRFDVVRVDLPITDLRHSAKVWNHVDELRCQADQAAHLARNGVRVGVASSAGWPAMHAIFDACKAEIRRASRFVDPRLPLTLEVGTITASESIFSYDRADRLVGKTFDAGEKLVHIGYRVHPELNGCTDVTVAFEVRRDRGVMEWQQVGGVIREVPAFDRHIFADLSALLSLNPGEFLVIGPAQHAAGEYLLGSRFLTVTKGGDRYETLYCITPQPYRNKAPAPTPP